MTTFQRSGQRAADQLRAVRITAGRAKLEASGGINESTLRRIAETGSPFIALRDPGSYTVVQRLWRRGGIRPDARWLRADTGPRPQAVLELAAREQAYAVVGHIPLAFGKMGAPGIELLDGGTAGMELLEAMASRDHIILADAVRSGNPPGTVVTLQGEEIPTLFGRKISPHQLGLADVLSALHMTGESPKRLTLIGIEPESLEPRIGLTPLVAAAMGEATDRILTLLASVGAPAIALSAAERAKQEREGLWRSPI